MRVQIYEEEMGEGVEVIETVSRNGEHFFGLRIWLRTCQPLLDHSTAEDDDRSAITLWAKDMATLNGYAVSMLSAVNKTKWADILPHRHESAK